MGSLAADDSFAPAAAPASQVQAQHVLRPAIGGSSAFSTVGGARRAGDGPAGMMGAGSAGGESKDKVLAGLRQIVEHPVM